MTQHEKDLLKYLGMMPGPLGYIFSGIMIALGIFFLSADVLPGAILFTVLGVILIFSAINGQKKNKAALQSMRESGELAAILRDYAAGQEMIGGKVILGHEYILGKGYGVPARYSQIIRVYQHIHKTNGAEDRRVLKGVLNNGKVKDLFDLQLRGKSDEELNQILAYILRKNPNVQIGYVK